MATSADSYVEVPTMDSLGALWAVASVFPVVIITALCIGCRRKIPVHITETGYYEDKIYNPSSSSFMVMKGPSGMKIVPRTSTSQAFIPSQEMSLIVPRSPVPTDSRRSSVGREMKGLPIPINQQQADEDHEYDEYPNYSNNLESTRGYIEVLPDDSSPKPAAVETESPSSLANRESLSSVIYVNVETPAESKEAADDHNYVNMRDSNESLEYVNVDEAAKPHSSAHQDSDDDDMPDYENMGNEHKG